MVALRIDGRSRSPRQGETLFEAAERMGLTIPTSCVKQGKCRECLLEITAGAGHLTPRTAEEEHLQGSFRLACRTRLAADLPDAVTVIAHSLRRSAMRIEEGSEGLGAEDEERFDPAVTRDGGQVLLDGEAVARWDGPLHGLALDLGTTTVALRLFDLEDGRQLASQSFENPQRFGGTDIMARIHFDETHPGRLLQRTLLGYLRRAIAAFPVAPESLFELVVAANTTMRDLFFGLDLRSIGQKPYRSITEHELRDGKRVTTALTLPARRLRLPMNPGARVYGLPLVSSHVGADAAAALLASGIAKRDELSALMDIGTNSEIFLGNRERLMAASCPAGPAFEGGAISCGMPGLDGAIERVRIDGDGSVETRVIGDVEPTGLCGSGLVDLLGELKRTGRMNDQGRYTEEDRERFTVAREGKIYLTEADINELAQAKGANVAGLQILRERYPARFEDIERFYLAGAFARHLDLAAARRIGLLPPLPDDRIVQVGNASLQGASLVLKSNRRRRELESLVTRIEHLELETDPHFFDFFVDGCQFTPLASEVARS